MKLLKMLSVASMAALPLFVTSCAYRADLNQGNYFDQDQVNTLTYGMTREQVRYVLGTPMVIDPYDTSRWYYVKFKREGWSNPEIKSMVLLFSGNILVDMSGDFEKPTTFGNAPSSTVQSKDDFELPE